NLASGANRVTQALYASDAASAQRRAIHNESVQLNLPVMVEEAASPGVEGLIIFHHHDRFFHGVQRRTAFGQRAPTRSNCIAHSAQVRAHHVIWNCPGAAMDYKNRIDWQEDLARRPNSLALGRAAGRGPRTSACRPWTVNPGGKKSAPRRSA